MLQADRLKSEDINAPKIVIALIVQPDSDNFGHFKSVVFPFLLIWCFQKKKKAKKLAKDSLKRINRMGRAGEMRWNLIVNCFNSLCSKSSSKVFQRVAELSCV